MNASFTHTRPTSIIFLDIDGVLIKNRFDSPIREEIQKKINELFERKKGLNGGFTELEWRIAASYSFSKIAVSDLENLIRAVNQVAHVGVVISSAWREDGTVDELKERMFSEYAFSRFIIDKTPEYNLKYESLSHISQEKYGFNLNSRGKQIDYWLRENHEKLNIQSFVIFDDYDEDLSTRFPHHFIKTIQLLSAGDTLKAYTIMRQFSSLNFTPSSSENLLCVNSISHQSRIKSERIEIKRKNHCMIL